MKLWEEQNQCLQKQDLLRKREGMAVEEKLRNKSLYKLQLFLLKVIPMCMTFISRREDEDYMLEKAFKRVVNMATRRL